MKIFLPIAFCIVLLALCFVYFNKYRSAFEADQACHYEQFQASIDSELIYGCDHDTETHKWILYENLDNEEANIIQIFRYKFL